jgi:predicted nucleotidyltransferase
MTDFKLLLTSLANAQVEFILVGGVAATAHGATRLTQDVDIVYRRTPDNIDRLTNALSGLKPYPRGAPRGLPFLWDRLTLQQGLNFTLTTEAGDIDLLGEITGGGGFESLKDRSVILRLFGIECRCLDLETLIEVKLAAGRPKDFEAIAELQLILEFRQRKQPRDQQPTSGE